LWNPSPTRSVVDETMADGVPWKIWRRSSLGLHGFLTPVVEARPCFIDSFSLAAYNAVARGAFHRSYRQSQRAVFEESQNLNTFPDTSTSPVRRFGTGKAII